MRTINLTVKELVGVVEGATTLDPSFLIKHIAALEVAQIDDMAVLFDPEDSSVFPPLTEDKIRASKAGLVLASRAVVPGKNYLLVRDPLAAFGKIVAFLDKQKIKGVRAIHPSASIGEFAVIEDNVLVGPYAVIEDDAKIGQGATIGAGVYIGRGAQIGCNVIIYPGAQVLDRCIVGDNSILHSGVVVGSDGFGYRVMKNGLKKVPHVGIVRVGTMVEVGANTCIDRAEFEETVIGDGVKIDNLVHIAHNVSIGSGCAILAQTGIAGSVKIGSACQIGGHVAIRDHITIGNYAKIVSKSAVMKDIGDGEVVCGTPAVSFSEWKRTAVVVGKLPEIFKEFKSLKEYIDKRGRRGFLGRLFGR